MYCSSCGTAVTQGLSYCNRCGAKLGGAGGGAGESPAVSPERLVSSMVFVFGMAAIAALMAGVRRLPDFDFGRVMAVLMMSFLMMFLVEGVFAWLLLRRRGVAKDASDAGALTEQRTTNELDAARARALPDPVPSVTENTTRLFEPIPTERRTK